MKKKPTKTGPNPERVKLNKPWEKAVGDALKRKRPPDGWADGLKPKKKKPA